MDATDNLEQVASAASHLGISDAALARSRAYTFFAELISGPVNAEMYEDLAAIPEFANELSELPNPVDDLAAAHYELFGLQLFAHAGVFLDPAALAGGDRVADMVARYHTWGFVAPASEGHDHLSCQLGFMAHLAGLEAGFHGRGDRVAADRVVGEQRRFLDSHMLPWMVPLLAAAREIDVPLFPWVVELAVSVAADHRRELGGEPAIAGPAVAPDAAAMLSEPRTSVRDIADYLLTPSRSGCWISRADIQRLGRGADVPRGFGARVQLLSNLLRNAAEYDRAGGLLDAIDSLLAQRATSYSELGVELELEVHARPWIERISQVRRMVGAIERALPRAAAAQEEDTHED